MNPPTPAIVSQSAVRRLPRSALLLFCVAYVLPGFLGREPWKTADVAALGAMLDLVQHGGHWWSPGVLGQPAEQAGLLPYWLGALFVHALPMFPADVAARVPFALLLAATLACTWYAVYHLARQPAALPVAFAFGGEARPADYARALADAGLLALVACLGLAQLSHETTPDVVRLAGVAAVLLGAARLAHAGQPAPWRGLLWWCLGLAMLLLAGAAWVALALGSGLLLWLWWSGRAGSPAPSMADASVAHPDPRAPRWAAALVFVGLLSAGAALGLFGPATAHTVLARQSWDSWGRLLVWFTWPAWPLVLWTLWRWRHQWRQPHLALPLWVLLVGVAHSATTPDRDRALLLALPAMATLAAFALPTLRRSLSALIDWFTLLFFSFCGLVIWVIWVAMMTGVPAKPAANVARLAPGFVAEFSWPLFLLGAIATACWLWLVAWRVGRHREALWKSLVLPAAGATWCWLLLMTLWLPLLDFGRSYGPVARSIATLVPAQGCVLVDGLSQAQIAALQHQGGLTLERTGRRHLGSTCRSLIASPQSQPTLGDRVDLPRWAFKATVSRLGDRGESLLLYQRVAD